MLIHGVDGSSESWSTVADAIVRRGTEDPGGDALQLVALDLRGRGSADMDGPWGVDAHAEDVASFLATLEEPVVLVGHSFGGHVAARCAADNTSLVEQLVLVDGGPPRLIPEGMTAQALADGALSNIVPNLEAKGVSADAVTADFHSMVGDERAARAVFDVPQPIDLVRAELGVAPTLPAVVPDVVVEEMKAAGLTLADQVVAGATHFSVLGDHSAAVVEVISG